MDGPITIQVGNEVWTPENYDGKTAGPSTLRSGIEQSRNLMTVRLAQDMGMKLVAEYAERFGVYDKMAARARDGARFRRNDRLRMVSGYSIIANGGRKIKPSLIDRIQDRYGKTDLPAGRTRVRRLLAAEWKNQPEPELIDNRDQVLDPMTAYQITSMMEGVVQRGTAATVSELGRPIAGKTGTTNDEKDAWFIGLHAGSRRRCLSWATTSRARWATARPAAACGADLQGLHGATRSKDTPIVDFRVPEGMKLIPIDRKTGMQRQLATPDTIIEAFKPGTGRPTAIRSSAWTICESMSAEQLFAEANRAISSGGGGGLLLSAVRLRTAGLFHFTYVGSCLWSAPPQYHRHNGMSEEHAMRAEIENARRRDQAGHKPAEEASLTGIRQSNGLTI